MTGLDERFGGVACLLGPEALARLGRAHVCVVGLGGVGSWAVEALARSGVGRMTLVDFDVVSVGNINRQIHALEPTLGQPKAQVLADRVRLIHPHLQIEIVPARFSEETAARILETPYDCLLDAIDGAANKSRLIAGCCARHIPIVTSGGAGGRRDPTRVRIDDLAFSSHDRLLAQVRAILRQDYAFPRGHAPFGLPCVHSTEPPRSAHTPEPASAPQPGAGAPPGDCDPAHPMFGTAVFVTGTFGFALASLAVKRIVGH
ncbi:MAG TPA: tRNA threonylcarbamoyladenosine dehydratase [Verrucomicrobiota bacterium]|nr:tRNA threonylcarbamoyladenosine dehydratase [Verrucomicrobiota bacterium]